MIEVKELTSTGANEELENIFYTLYGYRTKRQEAFIEFEGIKITTDDVKDWSDFDRLFTKVYGCGYEQHVTKKALKMRDTWIQDGQEIISPDKYDAWVEYVDSFICNVAFYHVGNPIVDGLRVIKQVNELEDPELIKALIVECDGSNNILVRAMIEFSNKGTKVAELYEQIKNSHKI